MVIENIDHIIELSENNDLEAIEKLSVVREREQNRTLNFRSALMVSAHNVKHLNKLDTLSSGCAMINLEDGVAKEKKPLALRLCALFLSRLPTCKKKLVVRVNALDDGGEEEILYLNKFKPDAIRIPKIETAQDVFRALRLIDESIEVHLSIETAKAWLNLKDLRVDDRVKVFYLGILDLLADLKLPLALLTPENHTIHSILSQFLLTSSALGVKPVSFVYQYHKNMQGFEQWLEIEEQMGFLAKGCISPAQSLRADEVFGISLAALSEAHYIVVEFEKKRKEGNTGFVDEKLGFIDEPIYKGARALLELGEN